MRRIFHTTLFTLCCLALSAQYTISGTVTAGENGPGFGGWPVQLFSPDGALYAEAITDEDGSYSFAADTDALGTTIWTVTTIDFCQDIDIGQDVALDPDELFYTVDLAICSSVDPPDPTDSCEAFFSLAGLNDGTLSFQFTNVSFSIEPIDEVLWDFGDGNNSTEDSPIHTYATGGFYTVSLTITAGNCVAQTSFVISVFDPNDCNCPDDDDPVCVIDHTGQLITFDNPCLATCAGYPADLQFSCDEDCFCPTFHAPVCVTTDGGDTLTFENHCFAECEGFGPDQWFDCYSPPVDPCDCDDTLYPVCVITDDGTQVSFNNECYAICAGFSPDQIDQCDPCPVDLAEFGIDEFCVLNDTGGVVTYVDYCQAIYDGYDPNSFFLCEGEPNCQDECPLTYDPVCVDLGNGSIIEYENSCVALCDGFDVDDFVDCEPVDPCDCDDTLYPVCVITEDGTQISFNNECYAICAGFSPDQIDQCDPCPVDLAEFGIDEFCVLNDTGGVVTYVDYCQAIYDGYNPDNFYLCDQDPNCVNDCPDIYDPVCVLLDNGNIIEYRNTCTANCNGYDVGDFVDCEPVDPCDCGHDLAYVCVETEDGEQLGFENPCQAECAGYTPDQFVLCDPCPFDEIFGLPDSSICALDPITGDTITLLNICEAFFLGYNTEELFFCGEDDGCECFHYDDPVCVVDSISSDTIVFENTCFATCAGYGPDAQFDCLPSSCDCIEIFDPVCVVDENGDLIEFVNECFAACEGYSFDDLVNCDPSDTCGCADLPLQPICIFDDEGNQTVFENPCYARCAGHFDFEFVVCDPCPYDIPGLPDNLFFCVLDPETGEEITFETVCDATIAGYNLDELFFCDNGTGPECQANFSSGTLTDDGLTFQFEDLSFGSDDSPIIAWEWDFGDGGSSDEANPTYTYLAPGLYEVNLTIITLDGCTATVSYTVIAGEDDGSGPTDLQCQSFFFVEQPDPANLLHFQFVDFTIGAVDSWNWDFGDGNNSDLQHPLHEYASGGQYQVTLTTTSGECTSTVSILLEVGDDIWYGDFTCRAWFLPIITSDSTVFFFNMSSPDAESFAWSFGDGTGSSDYELYHTYPGPGTYTVSLTTETGDGCQNTFTATITLGDGEAGFVSEPSFRILSSTSEVERAQQLDIRLAPNPTTGEVQLQWLARQAGTVDYQLIDAQGRLTLSGQAEAIPGRNQLRLDLSNQPVGLYLIRLRTPEGLAVQRLLKQ